MLELLDTKQCECAPEHWTEQCSHVESKLHQLSPYIGKLKSSIAADLVQRFSDPGDLVADPFCGSGGIPLESALAGRKVLAYDASQYATVLTKAKLRPPRTLRLAQIRLRDRLLASRRRASTDLRSVPTWVRRFFHPQTLREAIAFADECVERRDYFMLSCFLGILHHQRPGFLSYPSSHLVPYLRNRKYPRNAFPELYGYRDLESRMEKKIERALQNEDDMRRVLAAEVEVRRSRIENLSLRKDVDCVITSPPYMNALDYLRDNRLRLWFLDRTVTDYAPEITDKRQAFERLAQALAERVLERLKPGGNCVLVVGETVHRKRMTSHPASQISACLGRHCPTLRLTRVIDDTIPDVRRARRYERGTKTEKILVFEKVARSI